MKLLVASAFALGISLAALTAAKAMPLAPLDQSRAASSDVIQVFGGCGPGMHRGPYGGCRPLYNCPPGFHSGPYGRGCYRN